MPATNTTARRAVYQLLLTGERVRQSVSRDLDDGGLTADVLHELRRARSVLYPELAATEQPARPEWSRLAALVGYEAAS